MVNSIADSVDDVGVVLADDVANGIHGLFLGRVDGAVPRGSNALSEELSGLAQDVGALWERSRYQALFA